MIQFSLNDQQFKFTDKMGKFLTFSALIVIFANFMIIAESCGGGPCCANGLECEYGGPVPAECCPGGLGCPE